MELARYRRHRDETGEAVVGGTAPIRRVSAAAEGCRPVGGGIGRPLIITLLPMPVHWLVRCHLGGNVEIDEFTCVVHI